MKLLDKLYREDDGAAAIEYAIMVGLIAVVIVATVQFVGINTAALFQSLPTEMGWE